MTHHWTGCELNPDGAIGFVYAITNQIDGRRYIGRKIFWNTRRSKVKGRRNRKVTRKESNWRTYTSSSKELNRDIKSLGIENFSLEALQQFATKGGLHYGEIEAQILAGVLVERNETGERLFYNGNVAGCKFLPKESLSEETKGVIAAWKSR